MDRRAEETQFLYFALGLLTVADALVYLSIEFGLFLGFYPLEVCGYCLAVLAFVIVAAIGGNENGKTENNKTEFESNL